jgi:hypothetical protein
MRRPLSSFVAAAHGDSAAVLSAHPATLVAVVLKSFVSEPM